MAYANAALMGQYQARQGMMGLMNRMGPGVNVNAAARFGQRLELQNAQSQAMYAAATAMRESYQLALKKHFEDEARLRRIWYQA